MSEERYLYWDHGLEMEYCTFKNLPQAFPNHFHDYYVIGLILKGQRQLTCQQQITTLVPGDLFLLNPLDSHACAQIGDIPLDYQCLHISQRRMTHLIGSLIRFTENVVQSDRARAQLTTVFQSILDKQETSAKEELFYLLINELPTTTSVFHPPLAEAQKSRVGDISTYINQHYQTKLTLDDLSNHTGQNKYTLIRHFTKETGVTPYQYLETTRITQAKELLKNQITLSEISFKLGYTDQSHFTHAFKKITGFTPKRYQKIYESN